MADVANPTVTVNQPHSASSRAGIAWKKSWLHSMSAFAVVFILINLGQPPSLFILSACRLLQPRFFLCVSDVYPILTIFGLHGSFQWVPKKSGTSFNLPWPKIQAWCPAPLRLMGTPWPPQNGVGGSMSIWVNYNISLTWIKAIWGWFPLLTMISSEVVVRSL
jgi:hypothetical protein